MLCDVQSDCLIYSGAGREWLMRPFHEATKHGKFRLDYGGLGGFGKTEIALSFNL